MAEFYLANLTRRICECRVPTAEYCLCFWYIVPAVSKVRTVEYIPRWCRKCRFGCLIVQRIWNKSWSSGLIVIIALWPGICRRSESWTRRVAQAGWSMSRFLSRCLTGGGQCWFRRVNDSPSNSVFSWTDLFVIFKRVVARKIRLTRRFSLFCLLNK